ncbi:MAG: MATE family efflux transporter [Planctomycetota bacterium]
MSLGDNNAAASSSTHASPLGEVWSIAWPTVLTMTSYTVMQFVDALMVGQVSPLAVAAQGNGGIWAFTPIAIAMGFLTVVNTFVSQNLGAGRPEVGAKYAWNAVWGSIVVWLVVFLPIAAVLPWFMPLTHDRATIVDFDALVQMETGYAQILLVGGVFTLLARGLHHYFFGLHRPKVVTVAAILGNLVNIGVNYVLIFGAFGLPALGVYGAAIGTVVGTIVEALIPGLVFFFPLHREFNTRHYWRPSWQPVRDLLRIGWPAAVQYGNEIVCWAIFMTVLVGRFGEAHMTAGWATLRFMHLSFMPAVGFSVAATSLVGKYIGAGEPDTAVSRTRLALRMAVAYMTVCAVIMFVFRAPLIGLFVGGKDVTPEEAAVIIEIGAKLMICAAIFQTVDAFGIIYTGALRGAGDTVFPGVVTMIYSWLFIVAGGWMLVAWRPDWESVGPWIGAAVYIIMFGVTMALRFESGRWRSIKLIDDAAHDAARIAPISPGPPAETSGSSVRDIAEEVAESIAD